MKNKCFALLFLMVVWRVGAFVTWDCKVFLSMFDPESTSYSDVVQDTCLVHGSIWHKWYCAFRDLSTAFKSRTLERVQSVLPSPHSELVMGMVLGVNEFSKLPRYNDILKIVGLVHVVVVSGYNISLVFGLIVGLLGSQYKARNLFIGLATTLLYAGISGFGIPAVRAWLMGSVAILFKFYGRAAEGIKVLLFSAFVIILISPEQLFSISFQFSFMATLGVMALPRLLKRIRIALGIRFGGVFVEDFETSLSAQLFVNPLISYYFGTMSIISLVTNPLVLWVVPLCTVMGGVLVLSVNILPYFSRILAFIVFPFLDYFVTLSEIFSHFSGGLVPVKFSGLGVLIYYACLFVLIHTVSRFRKV